MVVCLSLREARYFRGAKGDNCFRSDPQLRQVMCGASIGRKASGWQGTIRGV